MGEPVTRTQRQFGPDFRERMSALLKPWERDDDITTEKGSRLIHRLPHIAPLAFLHRLHAPLGPEGIEIAQESLATETPGALKDFLAYANGASIFDYISLHGVVGQIDRDPVSSLDQPISLRYGNIVERLPGQGSDVVSLGGIRAYYAHCELLLFPDEHVEAIWNKGDAVGTVVATWPSFEAMVLKETQRVSALYDKTIPTFELKQQMLPPIAAELDREAQAKAKAAKGGPIKRFFRALW